MGTLRTKTGKIRKNEKKKRKEKDAAKWSDKSGIHALALVTEILDRRRMSTRKRKRKTSQDVNCQVP